MENPLIRRVFSLRYEMEHVSSLDRRQRIETRGYFVVPFENVVQTRGREKRRGSLFEIVRIIIIRDVCNRCLEGMEVAFDSISSNEFHVVQES